jgi:hypothetical protein
MKVKIHCIGALWKLSCYAEIDTVMTQFDLVLSLRRCVCVMCVRTCLCVLAACVASVGACDYTYVAWFRCLAIRLTW